MAGNSSSSSSKSWPHEDEFTELLLSWSVEKIIDEDLYKDQVQKIPETFESVDQYLDAFIFPLLQEVRCELASAMEALDEAPFCEIKSVKTLKHEELLYDVKVDYWRNSVMEGGKEAYTTFSGNFVLLSESKPCHDIRHAGSIYNLAMVRKVSELESGDGFTSSCLRLKTAHSIEDRDEKSKSLYMVYLMNMTAQKRIWSALRMRKNLKIIETVLTKNESVEQSCEFCHLISHIEVEEKLGSALLSKLNESQLKAILASVSNIECKHKSSLQLIWGPPGTGKTRTLSMLLYILLRMNVRTVVCAPSNTAITGLAARVLELARTSVQTEAENSFVYCLAEMLIFGNKENLKVGSDVQEIFVDYRVERLLHCLAPTGWKKCIASMIEFLEDFVSQHRITSKSFLDFARDQFTLLASQLKSCMLTLSTHLPRSYINEQNYRGILKLICLLDSIEMLLFEDCMTSSELEAIFLEKVTIDSESFDGKSSFTCIRSECLSVLKSLRVSLDNLGLPRFNDRTSTMEFCFKEASLIFCTTSSSFKLHSLNAEPFHLLVIDEAAQLKECETAIALQIPDVRHAILVGDEMQLPATVRSKRSEEAGFGRSLFERLSSINHPKHLLNVQYRMHPSISRFPNSKFYFNQMLDAPNVQRESYGRCYLEGRVFGSYSFINIRDGREEWDDVGHSRKNLVEVAVVMKLVHKLFKAWIISEEKLSIGLISPYAAQVAEIRDRIQPRYGKYEGFKVKAMTIDGFQGGEEDVIIISTVRSHKGGSIGFMSSPQRTNVALTRARHCLWILGNERTLCKSDSVWAALVVDAKDRQCFFNADEICDVRKTIIHAKKELDQLEDLLSRESLLFENSEWKVLFSENFKRSFQKLKSSSVKKLVLGLLHKVANGWRPRNVNVDRAFEKSSHVVKQFKVCNYYVICSIDIIKDSVYEQVLKVWDLLPMGETSILLNRLERTFCMYTDDFVNRCKEKLFKGNLELPKTWPLCDDIIRDKNSSGTEFNSSASDCLVENSEVNESLLLMKFYSLSTGAANYLISDNEGREVDLPFEVTEEESAIILFPKSSFILGRSGTGKTTILTMKLFRQLQLYCTASGGINTADDNVHISNKVDVHHCLDEPTLHQLFVTVSPKLCYAVKKHVSQLVSFARENFSGSMNSTGVDDIEEMVDFKDIPDTFDGIPQEKYPLVITFQKFLMMLDGSLGNSFFQRFRDVRESYHYEGTRSVALQMFIRTKEVTYERFCSSYWPHMNKNLTKNLDASRVFTEIMSQIKGGLQQREAYDSKRSREDYISMSDSRVSTLSSEKRKIIYDIFEGYEKWKLKQGEFDLADLVMDIHHRLKRGHLLGDKMDFVYIDEVQDLNMRQILLFRYICNNVDGGFVFSGDTAQTIAKGVDFRFEDIRSLFYNEFLMKSRSCEFSGSRGKGLTTDTFCLSQNFRTHTGVLKLAQSVVDLICQYFPQSIDLLAPETSRVHGEPPVVLKPGCNENSLVSMFGQGAKDCSGWVGFGAEQVILVRDDSARKEVLSYIDNQALVLTFVECKGLEFQDVFLYDFFGSSPMQNQWRVVYEFLRENGLHGDADSPKSFPSFCESRHNILCSELKQLYVAITRTRQRLWICENNAELFQPMLDYWEILGLVQVREIGGSLVKSMQRASSPEEWKSRGIKLFWENNYNMAALCFKKAGEETWEKRAKASRLRADMRLREAAEIFCSINFFEAALECFCDLGDYERAGRIYLEKFSVPEFRKAGECFSLARNYRSAAEVYAKGNFFRECLSACNKGKHFDIGLQYIKKWKKHASLNGVFTASIQEINEFERKFLEKKALECYRSKDNASLLETVRGFASMVARRKFLKSLDCLQELLVLEEESGNFNEAVEIARSLGNITREIDLLDKAEKFEDACMLIRSFVVSRSLWVSGNRGWPLKSFPEKVELLDRAIRISKNVSGTFHASIRVEAEVLLHRQRNLSELNQSYVASKKRGSLTGEILCVRKLLDGHFEGKPCEYLLDSVLHVDTKSFHDILSRNQVSVGSLVFVWNLWKVQTMKILECLDSYKKLDFMKSESTVEFCFDYFGIRKFPDKAAAYHLLNPDAAWAINVDKNSIQNREVVTLEPYAFARVAREFWHEEFISVGLRVMDVLQEVYKSCSRSKCSQSMCLLHIFTIAKFFLSLKSVKLKGVDASKVQGFLQLSSKFFDLVFPLDFRQSSSANMVSLRETALSRNLLEEIVCRNIQTSSSNLSHRQIGQAVMILLGYGKLSYGLLDKISERLPKGSSWMSFIDNLKTIDKPGSSIDTLIPVSHEALEETYNSANWRTSDYISPNCFFYLVERLVVSVPRSEGIIFASKSSFVEYLMCLPSGAHPMSVLFADEKSYPAAGIVEFVVSVPRSEGIIFASKSSFVEYLMCLPSGAHPMSVLFADEKSYPAAGIVEFVGRVVENSLASIEEMSEWIEISSIDCAYYLPVLMLKMVVIMCLLCLNWDFPVDRLQKNLNVPHIRDQLPNKFHEALERGLNNGTSFLAAVAEAFAAIGDPLVIVASGESDLKAAAHPNAVFLNLRSFSWKKELMKALL